MTRKDQIKILNDKIESNTNQYKLDRLNAEISAFSSGDLNKYEFLTRKDLKYKPNALDKARFEFSSLGKAFRTGLDKTAQDYQEEGVIKLLKDIRDGLRGGVNRRPNDNRPDDGFDNDGFDNDGFDDDSFNDDSFDYDLFDDDKDDIEKKYNNLLLRYFQLRKNMKEAKDKLDKTKDDTSEEIKDELDKIKDKLDKTKDDTSKKLDKTKDDTSKKLYDFHGFDINGKHKDTNDKYNTYSFDINGKHGYTNTKYDNNRFDINGKHKDTKDKYDPHGFNIHSKHKDANDENDLNGFDIYYTHKDTDDIYDPNRFHINGKYKDTDDIYDPNGFDINGKHKETKDKYDLNVFNINGKYKDTGTFLVKKNDIRKDISKNINWLKDKDKFLKLYDEIIKNGEFIEKFEKKSISSKAFKDFLEDILIGKINDNEIENYIEKINDIEKDLNKLKKSENIDKLKNYIKNIKDSVYGKDKDRIRTGQAKSFKDQKGKGHVNLPIALSKIYTNNSLKELISNIKQLVKNLYDNKQITKQVYNILNRAITFKNDS